MHAANEDVVSICQTGKLTWNFGFICKSDHDQK